MLTGEQWEKIHKKYDGLIWKISHNISGDFATANLEDNHSDLQVAALEAVKGFEKKTGESFDDFWGTKLFDQYIKTCLWNLKNNKGAKITKKSPILKGVVSTQQNEEVLNLEGSNSISLETKLFVDEICIALSPEQKDIIECIIKDPTLIKESGRLNIAGLASKLDLPWYRVRKEVTAISKIIKNEL